MGLYCVSRYGFSTGRCKAGAKHALRGVLDERKLRERLQVFLTLDLVPQGLACDPVSLSHTCSYLLLLPVGDLPLLCGGKEEGCTVSK